MLRTGGSTAVNARSPYLCYLALYLVLCLYPRLSVQRLRTLQQKKEAQAKASRRDIATLLERSKVETARIKVENSECIGSNASNLILTSLSMSSH
jgi:hypothetical protein